MKFEDKDYCRRWVLDLRQVDFRRWLHYNFHLEDHPLIVQWAYRDPRQMKIILYDFIAMQKNKLKSVIENFKRGKSKIVLVVGSRGSGKTLTSFWVAEQFKDIRKIYYSGLPSKDLPDFINFIKDPWDAPADSFLLIDETQIFYGARDFKKGDSNFLTKQLTTLRHRGVVVLFITQNSALVDLNLERLADIMLYKKPGLFQIDTEREGVKSLIFEKMLPKDKFSTLFVSDTVIHGVQNYIKFFQPVPDCWNDDISKPFSELRDEKEINNFIGLCLSLDYENKEILEFLKLRSVSSKKANLLIQSL